jgi:hypothetical protein
MSKRIFGFEHWKSWMTERAKRLSKAGKPAELRISNEKTSKPGVSFRLKADNALGQFDVWITGEADFDVMDAQSTDFVHHVWGMLLDDNTFESIFDDFVTRTTCHPTSGKIIPETLRSAWFNAKSSV